mgnify:CR=1 FL=1
MAAMLLSVMTMAQTLEKMQWFNEPESWEIKQLDKPIPFVWIKAVRRLDAVEVLSYTEGRTWLLLQAVTGYELFTGEKPDLDRMTASL